MPRTTPITQDEIQAYVRFCDKYGVMNDDGTREAVQNAEFVYTYFMETWGQHMTDQNFEQCFETIKPYLKLYSSPQHAEFQKLFVQLTPGQQEEFNNWYAKSGLVEDSYRSRTAILAWLKAHNMSLSAGNFQFACGQSRVQHLLEWKYVPHQSGRPRHQDDGKPFFSESANEPLWKRVKREREARDAANGNTQTGQLSHEDQQWRRLADGLASYGNTHAERYQVQRLYNRLANAVPWREVYEQLEKLTVAMKRRAAVNNRSLR